MANKFEKSQANKDTERSGLEVLLSDARFQAPSLEVKRYILSAWELEGDFGTQSFDCVLTPEPAPAITVENIDLHLQELRLVEMKTTKKPIRSVALNNFFFGATAREFALAERLGQRFMFAFVVLNYANEYGRPFAVLLTHDQVDERTRKKRVQYQVNFRSDIDENAESHELVIFEALGGNPASL